MNKTSRSFLNSVLVKYVRYIRVDNLTNAVPFFKFLYYICGDAGKPKDHLQVLQKAMFRYV